MRVCIDLMAEALASLSRGEALNPLRRGMPLGDGRSLLGMMPGALKSPAALGLKVVTVFPGNHGTEFDSHQGIVALFDPDTGVPVAILDASEVTAIRTAAVSGLATRLLAREDADELAILGSGVQARTHLEAVLCVREIRRVRVYSPSAENRRAFATREAERQGVQVDAVDSARAAVEGASVICTVTSSREPVLFGDWMAPGAHINAAGSSIKTARELDTKAVVRSRLFVDRRESTLNEAGDFLMPKAEGKITDGHILGEIGELVLGTVPGRRSSEEITLFKSLGLAVEDLAVAHYLDRVAREKNVGTLVELGGRRVEKL
jgi:ornithine cyclodeaminase